MVTLAGMKVWILTVSSLIAIASLAVAVRLTNLPRAARLLLAVSAVALFVFALWIGGAFTTETVVHRAMFVDATHWVSG